MKNLFTRELVIFSPIYFVLAFLNLRLKLYLTPDWFNGTLAQNHQLLLGFGYTNNEQSRFLQYVIPEWLHRLFSITIEQSYELQRLIFVFLAFICFHFYLRKWFTLSESFAGVLFLAAVMPLSYVNDLQESAPLLLLTFLLGLWAIRENNILLLAAVYIVGGLNNETILALPLVYFFYHFRSWRLRELLVLVRNTLLTSLPLILTIGPIRYITRDRPHLGGAWHLIENIDRTLGELQFNFFDLYKATYLYLFFIFGALWVYAFVRFSAKPLFLKRAAWMIPIFIAVHFVTGGTREVRQMLPLSFIIIPMALFYMFPSDPALSRGDKEARS